jgi:hypothetical protein
MYYEYFIVCLLAWNKSDWAFKNLELKLLSPFRFYGGVLMVYIDLIISANYSIVESAHYLALRTHRVPERPHVSYELLL